MAGKLKVYELAKQLEVGNQTLLESMQRLGIDIKNSMSSLGTEEVRSIREHFENHQKLTQKPAGPSGSVTEKRVGSRVIRRRAKPKTEGEAPPSEVTKAEAAPKAEKKPPEAKKSASQVKAAAEAIFKKKDPIEKEETPKKTKAKVKVEEAEAAPESESPAVEAKKEPIPLAPQVVVEVEDTKKRRRPIPSIIKKVATETHLGETIGPKPTERERKPAAKAKTSTDPMSSDPSGLRRVQEIDFTPKVADPGKEAGKRRLLQRQNTVFRSADFLKRELLHATRKRKTAAARPAQKTQITIPSDRKRVVQMAETIQVGDLARQLSQKAGIIIKKLMGMGVTASMNESIDFDTASLLAQEFQYEVKQEVFREEDYLPILELSDDKLKSRPPVVTIMGHVDHGKTSLLDSIRKAQVAEGEAGGITQHIGAYTVKLPKKGQITFLDTPGHEAFTAMRARGAKATDIVVLVVSAADGVMPQTIESIDHSKAANVPIIVAINKCDLPDANPDRVKQELAGHDLAPEDWGGQTMYVNVSAKTGAGISDLLEGILLQAEILELKANYEASGRGLVIESQLDKFRGPLATILIQHGKLHPGDIVVCGHGFGKVRAMADSYGKKVTEAGPSDPVEILGLPETPPVGEEVYVVADEKAARTIIDSRTVISKQQAAEDRAPLTLEEMFAVDSATKELRLILKSDVVGSAEAIRAALSKLPEDKVKVKILHASTGGITESDVNLAVASRAVVVGFNVRPDTKSKKLAERERVDIRTYAIIYELLDEVKALMEGLLDKLFKETVIGRAEVRDIFNIPKIGTVAGSAVIDGKVTRNCHLRLLRDSRVVYDGKIGSLKRFKEDVKEVTNGYECGIMVENFNDLKNGDQFEAYIREEVKATL